VSCVFTPHCVSCVCTPHCVSCVCKPHPTLSESHTVRVLLQANRMPALIFAQIL